MPDFMFAYHGGKVPETEEEGQKTMAAWMGWFEGMGPIIKDPGNPVGQSATVSASGVANDGGSNPLAGYSIITVASMDEALAHAKNCPVVEEGGSVEVAEIVELEMG